MTVYKIGSSLMKAGGGVWKSTDSSFGLLSRSLTAYATSGTAANANSSNYNNVVTSSGTPQRISFDISGLTNAQKTSMALYWTNDAPTLYWDFDPGRVGAGGSNATNPDDYTIESNTAAGGSLPASGWSTETTVTNNLYCEREHLLNLSGKNWVCINISSSSQTNLTLKVDLYDVSAFNPAFAFFGDSRMKFCMIKKDPGATSNSFGNLVAASSFGKNVPQICMGMSGKNASGMLALIDTYLADFPGCKYWVINVGTNDATATPWFSGWDTSVTSIVTKILAAGRVPFLETIGVSSGIASNVGTYNTHIASIIAANSGCFTGWDAATEWTNTSGLNSGDGTHRAAAGDVNDRAARATFYGNYLASH